MLRSFAGLDNTHYAPTGADLSLHVFPFQAKKLSFLRAECEAPANLAKTQGSC